MSDGASILGLDGVADADPELAASLRALVRSDGDVPDDLHVAASGAAIVAALSSLVPDALDRQRRLGIPDTITRATLHDVGRKHRLYGAETVVPWLLGILRGDVVELGRLQVEQRAGPHGHALHIPETGPLDPVAVDDSLARAVDLTGSVRFSCTSWLLDPRLAALPSSNIAAFAARFHIIDTGESVVEASADAAKFVFRRSVDDVLAPGLVEPRSRLERLVAETLRSGARWSEPTGVLIVS